MGSEAGDPQQRQALARAMAAALRQRACAPVATHGSAAAAAAPSPPAAPSKAQLEPSVSPRCPLPVSRILQRGSLAPKHDQTRCASASADASSSSSSCEPRSRLGSSVGTQDAAVDVALTLLRQLQQDLERSSRSAGISTEDAATVRVSSAQLDQILAGFTKALESGASSERAVEDEMQRLFTSHTNVFDERMQSFFIQNYIHEAECAKTFRAAVRRTSLVRRCLLAMYPSDDASSKRTGAAGARATTGAAAEKPRRWSASLVARAVQHHHTRSNSLEVCPEVVNPVVIETVKRQVAKLADWDFDVFAIADAVPGQTLSIVGNALLEKYDFGCHFRSSKGRLHRLLRQVEVNYHNNPYHNAIHAADVAQSLHHLLSVGGLGESLAPRTKCAAILAAIVHDVGHTSYSNNFHISVNDDLATRYVYRSPLEHMHCALTFQLLKNPKYNVLQGLTKIEQLEVRNLITDMVLATDNAVHSAYLAKLESLVCRSGDDGWRLCDPDDEKLVLQMALHAADVSNPAKSIDVCKLWAARIMTEFYEQGDKERALELPVSVGCDRENAIPVEKMQAGFIIGIVRPLFAAIAQLPNVALRHCLTHLDANLSYWQDELVRNTHSAAAAPDARTCNLSPPLPLTANHDDRDHDQAKTAAT